MARKPRDLTVAEFALLDHLWAGHTCHLTDGGNWRLSIINQRVAANTVGNCLDKEWVEYIDRHRRYLGVKLSTKGRRAHYRTGMREA